MNEIFAFFSFALGACIASFLNVVIWRVPRGESIVSPPSHCPKCNTPIKPWQNIPIFSYLMLRGKCAACKAPISPRYILIEILGGVLFLATYFRYNPFEPFWYSPIVLMLVVMWIWISLMIVGSMIDYDLKLLPDFVTIGGMVLGIVYALVRSIWSCCIFDEISFEMFRPLIFALSGLAMGLGTLGLIRYIGSLAFKREAMGAGDVLLLGAVGALFGPVAAIFTLIVSSLYGSIIGVGMMLTARIKLGKFVEIPYGPYICLACVTWMFAGPALVDWYLRLLGF